MAEDDLEYHITFPNPTSAPDLDDETSAESDLTGSAQYRGDGPATRDKEPVVFLLGWVGCQDRYLSKYSDMYDKKGCITIRYTAPTESIFLNPRGTEEIAIKILELIPELGLEDNPVFFHLFSNGGGFVYRSITELLHNDKQYSTVRVRGCIFDSCPGYRRLTKAAQAFMTTLNYNFIIRYLLGSILVVYLLCYRIFDTLVSTFNGRSTVHMFFEAMKNDKARCPQLYLYSKSDMLIPYMDVEEVLDHRRRLGIPVYHICWEDSDHVAHLKKYPAAYTQQCHSFIDMCLVE